MVSSRGPEELCPGGDRASVVAKKRGNARRVKGGRKVETLNESTKENSTVNVQWTQFGEEQKQVREPSTLVQSLLVAPVYLGPRLTLGSGSRASCGDRNPQPLRL